MASSGKDNYDYTGPTRGTRAELLAGIANKANWTGSDGNKPTWPSAFTVGTGGGGGNGEAESRVSKIAS